MGGLFFAYMSLRPASGALEPEARLTLWAGVLRRFFPWVFAAIAVLLLTGYWMTYAVFSGMGHMGTGYFVMQVLGWIMILMFLHVFFAPFKRLKRFVANGDYTAAAEQLDQIRLFVGIVLSLGLVVVAVAVGGFHF